MVFHTQTLDLSNIADCPELCTDVDPVQPMNSQQCSKQPSELFYQRDCISRDKDDSYIVRFRWKPNHPILTPNLTVCEYQTRALAKKLGRQPDLLQLYGNVINEQQKRNLNKFHHQIPSTIEEYITYLITRCERIPQLLL